MGWDHWKLGALWGRILSIQALAVGSGFVLPGRCCCCREWYIVTVADSPCILPLKKNPNMKVEAQENPKTTKNRCSRTNHAQSN